MIVYIEIDRERFDPGELEWIVTDASRWINNRTSGRTYSGPCPVNERPRYRQCKTLERL